MSTSGRKSLDSSRTLSRVLSKLRSTYVRQREEEKSQLDEIINIE